MLYFFNDEGLIDDPRGTQLLNAQNMYSGNAYCYSTWNARWSTWKNYNHIYINEIDVPKKHRLLLLLHKG